MSAPPPIPTSDPGIPAPSSTSSFWHQPPNSFLHAHRTTASLPSHAKTIIIGSGMAGSMLFYHLTQHSAQPDTLMLEARSTCWGATGRNGGHCKPMLYSHNNSFRAEVATFGESEALRKIRFEQLNLQLLTSYVREHKVTDAELVHLPSADTYFTASEFHEAIANIEALRKVDPELGSLLTIHDGDTKEGRQFIDTVLRTPPAVGAVTFPAAKLWPYRVVSHLLTNAVKEHGLNLQTTTPALSIKRSADKKWVVSTPRGEVTADKVVVAANAHTAHLLPVMRGWIYPVRAQMSALEPPKSLREQPLTHSYGLVRTVRRMAEYLIQRPVEDGGELMLGGGRDYAEEWGIGKQDGSIDVGVASFLRNAIGNWFSNETGFPGEKSDSVDEEEEEGRGLRQSFIERFRKLRVGGHSVWDLAEGLGMDEEREPETVPVPVPEQGSKRECRAKAEWTGTLGFSKDERPFVGRVPPVSKEDAEERGIPAVEDSSRLYMLAGFEGHGMAFTSGSAKALAAMITADEKGESDSEIFQWFPSSFEVTPERLGLKHNGEWVVVDRHEAAVEREEVKA